MELWLLVEDIIRAVEFKEINMLDEINTSDLIPVVVWYDYI